MTAGTIQPDDTTVSTAAEATTAATEQTTYLTETDAWTETEPVVTEGRLDRDGTYTTKDDVALYLYTYGELPQNFITKKEAQSLGWSGGSLEPYAPGCCIGGSYFGNYEGALPEAPGREYHECDIDTLGKKSRGAKRIVYSNDGLIYYTEDHYSTFELLYGEE
ncbi:MAG: ribonuclease [Oscillospiraceae bacterium]|nr:ribonuclease [Oscillospiraceae bacterium]